MLMHNSFVNELGWMMLIIRSCPGFRSETMPHRWFSPDYCSIELRMASSPVCII